MTINNFCSKDPFKNKPNLPDQKMAQSKLKIAVLGLDGSGQLLLEAASKSDYFQIQAVADSVADVAQKIAKIYNCEGFDDYRQLIIQNNYDCLLVGPKIYDCYEYIRMAMKNKINILKIAPPARSFEETVELSQIAEHEGVGFAVADRLCFHPGFVALKRFLEEKRIEQVFFISATCSFTEHEQLHWQTDAKLAGGGVLLYDCYGMIDKIADNFGVPQQVYSLNTKKADDRQQRLYLTEDTTVLTMNFADNLIGNLIASRQSSLGAEQQLLKIYGKDKILAISNTSFILTDNLGEIIEELKYEDNELCYMTELLENFAMSILSPEKNKFCRSIRKNLRNMAIIESAYLSARTAVPEEPNKMFEYGSRK